ncbi:MAG TPA: TetR family transcriptional regulator C-terminal domain-containing protein [Phototrophicaceae bacterium]|jgi:TetR/AcrR family transcriptional repressor of nem operon|nr:TetR family transcriptional regulator C-terminal domain-containing protein [Phototrophicaceae bacterium]
MSRQKRNQENTQELLNAGLAIIIQQGYNHTGIKEIVDYVQIPKGSFYNYFASKEDFGVQVIQHYAGQVAATLDQALAREDVDALTSLREFFKELIASYELKHYREGCLVGNCAAELADTSDLIRAALADALAGWRQRTAQLLAESQAKGQVRGDLPADFLADFLWNSFEGSLLRMKIEKSLAPLEQWYQLMLDDFILKV